jgi:cytoskeletal protein RodZ
MADKKEEDKVFDVAKPGESKPETGSKPMVVGHKLITSDPDVKENSAGQASDSSPKEDSKIVAKSKLKIAPLENKDTNPAEVEATEESKPEADPSPAKKENNTVAPTEKSPEEIATEAENAEKEAQKEPTKEEIQSEVDKVQLEREKRLQEIIKSKEYNVPLSHTSSSSVRTFVLTFLAVCVVGALVILLLQDAEIIDLGISLPFDFI